MDEFPGNLCVNMGVGTLLIRHPFAFFSAKGRVRGQLRFEKW